jgi:hypothetical protein
MPPAEAEKRREQREARDAKRRKRTRREPEEEAAEPLAAALAPGPPTDEPSPAELAELAELAGEEESEESLSADVEEGAAESASETSDRSEAHPLVALLGAEGLMRLRARHASLTARIRDVGDDVKREALRLEAERLDPDTWVTEQEARQALETYEASFEALRAQLGHRRRRRRRRPHGKKSV